MTCEGVACVRWEMGVVGVEVAFVVTTAGCKFDII